MVKDMQVADVYYSSEEFGSEEDPKSDWALMCTYAIFEHKTECEFIFYIGDDDHLEDYKSYGFSETFLKDCQDARAAGFKYICFHP